MTHIKRLTLLVITGLSICALLFSSLTPTSYSRRPAAAATAPRPDQQTIKLPGEIKINPADIVPVDLYRKPIEHVPFTVEELQTFDRRVKMVKGIPAVLLKNGRYIALARFVEELNIWERYLNLLGHTLRDGKLAVGQPPNSRAAVLRRDLGPILKLREEVRPLRRRIDKATRPPLIDYSIVEDPYIAVSNPSIRVDRAGGVNRAPTNLSVQRSQSNQRSESDGRTSAEYRTSRADTRTQKNTHPSLILLAADAVGHSARAMEVEMPCVNKKGCPCDEVPSEHCLNGVAIDPQGRRILCDIARGEPVGTNTKYPTNTTTNSDGSACGEKSAADPPCLYAPGASMHAKWAGISSCTHSEGKWFNASLCSEMSFTGEQEGHNLTLINAGQIHFDVKLFGTTFNLLQGSGSSQYKDGKFAGGGAGASVPYLGLRLGWQGFSGNFEMPPVTIPLIEPFNLKITGGGAVKLGFSNNSANFASRGAPSSCDFGAKGELGFNLWSSAYADLHLTAAIDAIVASAGIKGVLVLADDQLGELMTDIINPSQNEIVVSPEFNYHIQHLAGHVYAVLTLDVILYSKTFEVELINFDGFRPPDKKVVITPRTFSSKISG